MDLKQLRYFLRVAELGSFFKAADILGVGQPTLSRQVRALEVELKTSFFHRNGRGVLLTPMGARFVDQARGVLHAADAAIQVLSDNDRRLTGHVVCGLTPSVGTLIIPEYVRGFRTELPDATLSIVNHLSTSLFDQLRASRLDFAIFHNPPPSPDLSVTELGQEALYLVGPKPIGRHANEVSLKSIDNVPVILPSRQHAIRNPIEVEAARLGVRIRVVLEVDVMDSIFQLVSEGSAYTIATRFPMLSNGVPKGLAVQKIIEPELFTRIALVTLSQHARTPLQDASADLAHRTYVRMTAADSPGAGGVAAGRYTQPE